MRGRLADDAFGVVRAPGLDVVDGRFHAVHDTQIHLERVVFRAPAALVGRHGRIGRERVGSLVGMDGADPLARQDAGDARHKSLGDSRVHQQGLHRVAHAWTRAFRVHHDALGHIKVGRCVHVDVADAGSGLDDGHLRATDDRVYQALRAARDEQIHMCAVLHEFLRLVVARALAQHDGIGRDAARGQRFLHRVHERRAALVGFLAALQHAGAARLQGKSHAVGADVGARLEDDADHADGAADLFQVHAARDVALLEHAPERVGQGGHLHHALGYLLNACLVEREALQHRLCHASLSCGGAICFVGCQHRVCALHQPRRVIFQHGVARRAVQPAQRTRCDLGGGRLFEQVHRVSSFIAALFSSRLLPRGKQGAHLLAL